MLKKLQILKNKNHLSSISAKRAFAIFALFLLPFLIAPTSASASLKDQLDEINRKLSGVREQLTEIRGQEATLQDQVAGFNSQINAIEYKIQLTNEKISLLQSQIVDTEKEMAIAEKDLAIARSQLSEVIRVTYEDGQLSALEVVAKSNSFSEYVNRSEYLEQMQLKIKQSADKVLAIKNKLEEQKKLLENDKKEALELRAEQQSERSGLAVQKAVKDELLSATQGSESKYVALMSRLQKQRERVEAEMWQPSGDYVSLGHVNKGDIIGYQGNTGYSTGSHLHFEIRTPQYVAKNPVTLLGDGYWSPPLPGSRISCGYGCYSGHRGTDFVKYYGAPIYATAEGDIVRRVTGQKNTYPDDYQYGNYVKIRHANGWFSLYAHLR